MLGAGVLTSILGFISEPVSQAIDNLIPDKDLARRLQSEISNRLLTMNSEKIKKAASVIVAEAQGASWLQRNWRPLTMMSFVAIIVNNYILAPYLSVFGLPNTTLDIPPAMWTLLQLGIGGYIGSRGAEKIVDTIMVNRK